ncbi:hypothetical protein FNV43_RR22575 [Rhamnella rubrinervis]|uniref:COBRA C-terminal domain-containing protein n=1 Tax=Rhamnella rubrinervis TaxID=2594499 RepID=A0A8K0DRT5_9ROSA|nr:hypothetical protein FNV43_RR22575 [Rhamnella rubrinervis]
MERPGWRVGWAWKGDEAIWNMWGAESTEQGDCSKFKGSQLPHCCEKQPTIVDLMPGAPYNMQVPLNKFRKDGSLRFTQALATWNVTYVYSKYQTSAAPKCCVFLSVFYNDTIVPCPDCSGNCHRLPGVECVRPGETRPLLQLSPTQEPPPLVACSSHMCSIRVHWDVKQSYKEYWRVKITITNLNFLKNYSQWNLVMEHPNLQNVTQVFSFNYHALNQYRGAINDAGMVWGIQYYNDELMVLGESGNVQSEMLLHKDKGIFTLSEGWAFPRRISFNGDECVMPLPDSYPTLLNTATTLTTSVLLFSLLMAFAFL